MPQRYAWQARDQVLAGAGADGVVTVDAGGSQSAVDSLAARLSAEATHVDGALAAYPATLFWEPLPIAVPLGAEAVRQFAVTLPNVVTTLAGGGSGTVIQMLEPDATTVVFESMDSGVAAAPSPRGFLDPVWLAARNADAAVSVDWDAGPVEWADPASIAGAAVMMIGTATLVLSNWPMPF